MKISREEETGTLINKLKSNNISLIGGKSIGKTLAAKDILLACQTDDYFDYVVYWDFRDEEISNKAEFQMQLAKVAYEQLQDMDDAEEEALQFESAYHQEADKSELNSAPDYWLRKALETIHEKDKRLLIIYDHFDYVISSIVDKKEWGRWFRQLSLDYQKSGKKPFFQMAITPKAIKEHLKDEAFSKKESSLFSDRFNKHHRLSSFGIDSIAKALKSNKMELDQSAQNEFMKWTGGEPYFSGELTELLIDKYQEKKGKITAGDFEKVREKFAVYEDTTLHAAKLWDYCSHDEKECMLSLAAFDSEASEAQINSKVSTKRILESKGFIKVSDEKIKKQCRFIWADIEAKHDSSNQIKVLFEEKGTYQPRLKSVLELHLERLKRFDAPLHDEIEKVFKDDDLGSSLFAARLVAGRALVSVWNVELGVGKEQLPAPWVEHYDKLNTRREGLAEFIATKKRLPKHEMGWQVDLISHLTGGGAPYFRPRNILTKYVSQPTAQLLGHIHWFGNMGAHFMPGQGAYRMYEDDGAKLEAQPAITYSYLNNVRNTCLALVDSMEADFGRSPNHSLY